MANQSYYYCVRIFAVICRDFFVHANPIVAVLLSFRHTTAHRAVWIIIRNPPNLKEARTDRDREIVAPWKIKFKCS